MHISYMILQPPKRSFLFSAFLTVSILFLVNTSKLQAAHIVGGDVVYTFLNFNADSTFVTYRITFTMYRDANLMIMLDLESIVEVEITGYLLIK